VVIARERIETGSGVGVTVNLSQIIKRNPRFLEYSDAKMEAPISSSLTTGPSKFSGDSLTGGVHFIAIMEIIYPNHKVIGLAFLVAMPCCILNYGKKLATLLQLRF
ncbi:hypothetical protein MKX03_020252, partial [Papaver bracteatum]